MNPLEIVLPGLVGTNYQVTSPADDAYNCLAWAAHEVERWWWPDSLGTAYWPEGVPRTETLTAFIAAYAMCGFVPAVDDSFEPGFEKIAIYAKSGKPTHAARQLPSGRWTSKLGRAEDIEHDLSALNGDLYGTVAIILHRPQGPSPTESYTHDRE